MTMMKKCIHSTYIQFHSKTLMVFLTSILVVITCYFSANQTDPYDPKHLKHGFIKVIPDHLSSMDGLDPKSAVKDTLSCAVPPIVNYVWCRKDNFQFQNYLSVLSAYKLLKPTEIIFHYVTLPEMDKFGYYQFYGDLLRDLPNFFPIPLEDNLACSDDHDVASGSISKMLNEYGGIFLGLDVILSQHSLDYLDKPLSGSVPHSSEFSSKGLLFQSRGILDPSGPSIASKLSSSTIRCSSHEKFQSTDPCAFSQDELFPYQIFTLESPFGELARSLAYGKTKVLKPAQKSELIPNIVHYVWLGKRPFGYYAYLSLLGSVSIQKAETVYVHGDAEPYGQYWDDAKKTGKVKFIMRDYPKTVYGNKINEPAHASDYLRFDILNRHGGIYLDWDFFWTKELSNFQRSHDVIACVDWPRSGKFPDTFNMGIIGSVKGAAFTRYMMETFRHHLDFDWGYNAVLMPYKVYEQHPETLFIDRHLQVISFDLVSHPVWVEGYKRELSSKQGDEFDWRTETNGVHTTFPNPYEYKDRETLLGSSGMLADIGKNILHKAELVQ